MKFSAFLAMGLVLPFVGGCEITAQRSPYYYDGGGPVVVTPDPSYPPAYPPTYPPTYPPGYPQTPIPPGGWDPRPVPIPSPVPGGGWPAANRQQDAMNAVAEALQRMFNVVASYGTNNYTQLRGDMNDLGRSVNEVSRRIQRGDRRPEVRDAYSSVLRDAETVGNRVRSINANDNIRSAWSYVRSRIDYATDVINRGDDTPKPGDVATVGAMVRASEDVINGVNEYLRNYEDARRPEAMDLKAALREVRSGADNFRNSARAGSDLRELRRDANEVVARFNSANDRYTYLVSLDRKFRADAFDRIAAGVNRIQQSVR